MNEQDPYKKTKKKFVYLDKYESNMKNQDNINTHLETGLYLCYSGLIVLLTTMIIFKYYI